MAVVLDESQTAFIATRRKPSGTRPKYFNAAENSLLEISEDFEAYLILQGKKRNSDTIAWLDNAKDLAAKNLARDALAAQALKWDVEDAVSSQFELQALINSFNEFRNSYQLTGFENVVEAGMLLQDVQLAMSEMQSIIGRLKHRELSGRFALKDLVDSGVTSKRQRQIASWYSPLCAY